jgi:SAM-dependent methyltransferase
MESKLLDMRDCADARFRRIYGEMLAMQRAQQPWWVRPLLARSRLLRRITGYGHATRAWEYPWAVLSADLGPSALKILDVGGGGSPFAPWLAAQGHECIVIDPSLNDGLPAVNRRKGLFRNLRSLALRVLTRCTGVRRTWGLPSAGVRGGVLYLPDSAAGISLADASVDRVFCLSVLEHVPQADWARCMGEFQRVLRPGGRLVVTLDMSRADADARQYRRLVEACSLRLLGDTDYVVPIAEADSRVRHPDQPYETIGLVWQG